MLFMMPVDLSYYLHIQVTTVLLFVSLFINSFLKRAYIITITIQFRT